jgi:ketosteroid isomerase-like protein
VVRLTDSHRALIERFNARDLEGMLELIHPDVEFHARYTVFDAPVYRGHEGVEQWHRNLVEIWERIHTDVDRIVEVDGQRTLLLATVRGRARRSGVELSEAVGELIWWRGGRATKHLLYRGQEEALRAAGLDPATLLVDPDGG